MTKRLLAGAAVALALLAVAVPAGAAHHDVPSNESGPAAVCAYVQTACTTWQRVDTWDGHRPVVEVTTFTSATQPGVPVYAAWMRADAIDLGLYLGYKGPGATTLPRGPEEVPLAGRVRLLAVFNSGFYEADSPAGFYTNHTLYFPMVRGQATIERLASGRLAMVAWEGGARPPANVVMARQNLTLLVQGGKVLPGTAVPTRWGLTLHGAPEVWRSALGLDKDGNLIYLAAPDQTAASLAALMVQVHAVTAMQLDINPEWPIFATYGARGGASPALDVANPNQIASRFLYPSTKDFFAVYATRVPGEATPW